ncbi:hypothetical protein E2C01_068065 [Portunus trituberculatus]|uniref:Uncharacterized protein n=1 Tax=Portunus trituberculatus TaxID=210409 RepID=A0A5B7HYH2_PORTR|nr:hypothetical protein [Portunus trituberculatus]
MACVAVTSVDDAVELCRSELSYDCLVAVVSHEIRRLQRKKVQVMSIVRRSYLIVLFGAWALSSLVIHSVVILRLSVVIHCTIIDVPSSNILSLSCGAYGHSASVTLEL